MVSKRGVDYAARESYAIRCKTNGPRILEEYASRDIMNAQYKDAEVIINAYLEFIENNGQDL